MKIITKKEILPVILIFLAFLIGLIFYSKLPAKIPSHWNVKGEVDAWSGKDFAVFFLPSIIIIIYLLMTFIPFIDPLRRNYQKFAVPYFWFRTIFVIFFVLLYLYTLSSALGLKLNINYFIIPGISLLFIFIGFFLPKIRKNYFVGIRTPWTIHSETVWDKTHRFSGKIFIVAGLISLLSICVPKYSFAIFFSAILLAALISVVYSYLIFRKIEGFKE